MQVATNADVDGEPRNLNMPKNEALSVAELETVPFRKRLEILFISTIIPSRRQLAFKYGLDEQLVHNVLSHRNYLLQNWIYNPNTEHLLTKLELENAMAIMELLIDWKHRVEMSGLQMTHAALLRKTLALQKIFKVNTLKLSDDWWQLFSENWEHKRFHDSDSDSLEFEDILIDLQWMFSESTFNRLSEQLRQARSCNRTRIKRENSEGGDGMCVDDENSNELNELLDSSEVKSEPLYYNDDEFECEDYEFVLDEELVFDSLRREFYDNQTAKYKRFMEGDNIDFSLAQEEEKTEGFEEVVEEFEISKSECIEEIADEEMETKTDIVTEEVQENSKFFTNIPPDSTDPLWSIVEHKVPVPIRLEIVNPVGAPIGETSIVETCIEIPKPTRKPYRRKPRNVHAVPTVRKDSVRLPTSMEIANFSAKRKYQQNTTPQKLNTFSHRLSPSPQVQKFFESVACFDDDESISVPSEDETIAEISTMLKPQTPMEMTNKNDTIPENCQIGNDEGELILGINSSFSQAEEITQLDSSAKSHQIMSDRRKQKFNIHKLRDTNVQILTAKDTRKADKPVNVSKVKSEVQTPQKSHLEYEKKTSTKSSTKRIKRRTDDSDLTLRRDKVRITLPNVIVGSKLGEHIP